MNTAFDKNPANAGNPANTHQYHRILTTQSTYTPNLKTPTEPVHNGTYARVQITGFRPPCAFGMAYHKQSTNNQTIPSPSRNRKIPSEEGV